MSWDERMPGICWAEAERLHRVRAAIGFPSQRGGCGSNRGMTIRGSVLLCRECLGVFCRLAAPSIKPLATGHPEARKAG